MLFQIEFRIQQPFTRLCRTKIEEVHFKIYSVKKEFNIIMRISAEHSSISMHGD